MNRIGFLLVGFLCGLSACGRNEISLSNSKDVLGFNMERGATLGNMSSQSVNDLCASGLEAFKKDVHPILRKNCAFCHGDGSTVAPQHSVADPAESYVRIKKLVNFNDIEGSRFYTKGGNQHCLESGIDCETGFAEIKKMVENWWIDGEKDCVQPEAFVTAEQNMPANLPTSKTEFVPMRWDLSSLDPSFSGVYFEMEAQQMVKPTPNSSGAYRFRRPRLATANKAFHIKGIKILVNGQFDELANEWADLEADVNPATFSPQDKIWPHPTLASQHLIVIQKDSNVSDKISVAFDALRATTEVRCAAIPEFKSSAYFALDRRNCFTCHGGQSDRPDARARFDLSGSMESICANVKQRVNSNNVTDSILLAYAVNGFAGHQRIFISSDEAVQYITPWISKENSLGLEQILSLSRF